MALRMDKRRAGSRFERGVTMLIVVVAIAVLTAVATEFAEQIPPPGLARFRSDKAGQVHYHLFARSG